MTKEPGNKEVMLSRFKLNDAARLFNLVAKDADRVFFTRHAEERMIERNISRLQVLRCLIHGQMHTDYPKWDSRHSNWIARLETVSAGDVVTAIAALCYDDEIQEHIVVITTYE